MIYSTLRHRGPKLDLGAAGDQDVCGDPAERSLTHTLLQRLGYKRRRPRASSLTDLFAHSPATSTLPITRIDQPSPALTLPALPALDIAQIIRHKDEHTMGLAASYAAEEQQPPESPQTACTAVDSDTVSAASARNTGRLSTDTAVRLPSVDFMTRPSTQRTRGASLDVFSARPQTAGGRPSTATVGRRLRHDYFRVATMEGKPVLPAVYRCPIALCEGQFTSFALLQDHWTEHPWNRGGILTPVCDGGVRRLGWWQHKRRFFMSLVQGRNEPEFPELGDVGRRRAKSIDQACRSDYGDISLLGCRTYHVSPRVVSMWQVAQWESLRDTP
ncbi:hypothetical protein GGI05_002349 [Coemansia sp. RSA 2603]|nr:hypothetical protein GGI05_002349 [Coemansia sp. RSA 2603]